MKKLFLCGVLSLGVLLLTGCDEKWNAGGSGQGRFRPSVTLDEAPVNSRVEMHESRATNVSPNDLKLTLTHHTGKKYTWNSVADVDPEQSFPIGTYTLEAYYGKLEDEGFDKPHFYGSSEKFTIRENLTSTVSVKATYGNSLVTIVTTDAFKNYFSTANVSVMTQKGNEIEYLRNETRPVHVAPGTVEVKVLGTKQNSSKVSTNVTFTAKAAYQHIVTIDVNDGKVGGTFLEVTFSDELELQPFQIDLNQDLSNTEPPVVTPNGFDDNGMVSTVAGNAPLGPLEFHIHSKGGKYYAVMLETEDKSATLTDRGWPTSINLVAPTTDRNLLKSLGLREAGLWTDKPGDFAVVDLAEVCSFIAYRNVEGIELDNKVTFKLTVTDMLGQVSEPVTVTVEPSPRTLGLTNPSTIYVDQTTMSVDVTSNGPNMDDVLIQYKKDGTWFPVVIAKQDLDEDRSTEGNYISRFDLKNIPEDLTPLELRAIVIASENGIEDSRYDLVATLPVDRLERPFRLVVNENNIFATKGKLTIESDDPSITIHSLTSEGLLQITALTDEDYNKPNIQKDKGVVSLNRLMPGTTYRARLQYKGAKSGYITFTTEKADTLPNRDLERWSISASGSHWERYAVDGWATYNIMTTNSGVDAAYVRRSGTVQSNSIHKGQSSAELRTVGWGNGNTSFGDASITYHVSPGMLYLGESPTTTSQLNESIKGIDFYSRPSSITFWYKYEKYNSEDYGGMLIWVKDADGNIIAQGQPAEPLTEEEYTKVTVPLTYAEGSKKAASIYVEFSSSAHPNRESTSSKWLRTPAAGSGGYRQGSSMFVDDISLSYN